MVESRWYGRWIFFGSLACSVLSCAAPIVGSLLVFNIDWIVFYVSLPLSGAWIIALVYSIRQRDNWRSIMLGFAPAALGPSLVALEIFSRNSM